LKRKKIVVRRNSILAIHFVTSQHFKKFNRASRRGNKHEADRIRKKLLSNQLEETLSFENLCMEYESFLESGNSDLFAWCYLLTKRYGVVIDHHITLYRFDKDIMSLQKNCFPWFYPEQDKYIADTWWFEDEEVLHDITHLSLVDFMEKYD